MRFSVSNIMEAQQGGDYHPHRTYLALCELADGLNASLVHYEVALEHHCGEDFLRFELRSAEEIADIEEHQTGAGVAGVNQ